MPVRTRAAGVLRVIARAYRRRRLYMRHVHRRARKYTHGLGQQPVKPVYIGIERKNHPCDSANDDILATGRHAVILVGGKPTTRTRHGDTTARFRVAVRKRSINRA